MYCVFLAKDPCQQNSLGCKHICFLSDGKEKCSCRAGYALEQDGKTCTGIWAICLLYWYIYTRTTTTTTTNNNNNNKKKTKKQQHMF